MSRLFNLVIERLAESSNEVLLQTSVFRQSGCLEHKKGLSRPCHPATVPLHPDNCVFLT
jgi:hypothetical protein